MDSYEILGVSKNATQDEIKKAYRREAMKYHPDRAGQASESIDKFHRVTQAYKRLAKKRKHQTRSDQFRSNHDTAQSGKAGSEEVFLDIMIEYAVGLAHSGLSRKEVESKITQNGLNKRMAASIASRAFHFRDDFASTVDVVRKKGHKGVNGKEDNLDNALMQTFLGDKPLNYKGRYRFNHYQAVFHKFLNKESPAAGFSVSKNDYLSRLVKLSILALILTLIVIDFLPGLVRFLSLGAIDLLQMPNILLSLVLVWTVYRKLWLLALIGLSLFILTQVYFYLGMPAALGQDFTSIIIVALICIAPFIVLTLFADYFYYLKARRVIESVSQLYPNREERLVLVKNSGGTSSMAAFVASVLISLYFLQVMPENGSLYAKVNWLFSDRNALVETKDMKQAKIRISESERLFLIAETHFNHQPPEYQRAETAYIGSAMNGSLLSAYKLGYIYITGQGVTPDDRKAFHYFTKAVEAPLASQPHDLALTTRWLAESYNNLGIMYLAGYGVSMDRGKASDMFKQASKYGSTSKLKYLMKNSTNGINMDHLKLLIAQPEYNLIR